MLDRLADDVVAASAQFGAESWPEQADREAKARFVYDRVISAIIAYRDLEKMQG